MEPLRGLLHGGLPQAEHPLGWSVRVAGALRGKHQLPLHVYLLPPGVGHVTTGIGKSHCMGYSPFLNFTPLNQPGPAVQTRILQNQTNIQIT